MAAPIPDVFLRTISQDIRDLILRIKEKLRNGGAAGNAAYNGIVNEIVNNLEGVNGVIDNAIREINMGAGQETIDVGIDPATRNYRHVLRDNYGGIGHQYLNNMPRNRDGTVGPANAFINMNSLDSPDGTKPVIDADGGQENLDITDAAQRARLENRLKNCQYLEILYLIKHEELMKTFAFTLNLYKKYEYAIKILLYILKNISAGAPGVIPPVPPHEPERLGPTPRIRLPKALITNIKKLLQDQKSVQDVIGQMEQEINRNPNLGNLLNPTRPPTSEQLTNPNPPGNLGDLGSPP